MKLSRSLTIGAVVLCAASPATAQYPYPLPTSGKVGYLNTTNSMGGVVSAFGVAVGPYSAKFAFNGGPFGARVDIFCVDFLNRAITSQYNANFTNLATGDMSKTRGGATNKVKYIRAAYLAAKMNAGNRGTETTSGTPSWRNLHGAIWNIMDGTPTADAGIQYWTTDAQNACVDANSNCVNLAEWTVITDTRAASSGLRSDGYGQEYLTNVVPEPATILLLGTGLLGMLLASGALRRLTA